MSYPDHSWRMRAYETWQPRRIDWLVLHYDLLYVEYLEYDELEELEVVTIAREGNHFLNEATGNEYYRTKTKWT